MTPSHYVVDRTPRYDSCHHIDTTPGDTFGGIGTSEEVRIEEIFQHSDLRIEESNKGSLYVRGGLQPTV